jgi:hypothetical protein
MSNKNDGGPAFPCGYHPEGNSADQQGMTLRDWFAGQALAGLCASTTHDDSPGTALLATWAYQQADAMLKARDAK